MKVKITKKPKKYKKVDITKILTTPITKKQVLPQNTKANQNYLNFYDDIKTPSQKYDW